MSLAQGEWATGLEAKPLSAFNVLGFLSAPFGSLWPAAQSAYRSPPGILWRHGSPKRRIYCIFGLAFPFRLNAFFEYGVFQEAAQRLRRQLAIHPPVLDTVTESWPQCRVRQSKTEHNTAMSHDSTQPQYPGPPRRYT